MKENIAIIVPKLSSGGSERVASNISLFLDARFNRYIILYFNDKIDFPYKGQIINLNLKSNNNPLSKILNFVLRIYKIKRIKFKYNIEATISIFDNANLVNIFSKFKDKVVITEHFHKSGEIKNIYGKLYDWLIKIFYNKADWIITVSKSMRDDLIQNYRLNNKKVKAIYNFYDIDLIEVMADEELEEMYHKIFDYPVIINIGRLCFQKGQWHLLKSFKLVKNDIQNAKLVFLSGNDEIKNKLIQLSKDLNIFEDVHFLDFHQNPYKFLNKATLFALSSLWEGFPNVLVEALACGCPIVAVDCKSGPRELLDPGNDYHKVTPGIEKCEYGILIPPFDNNLSFNPNQFEENEKIMAKAIILLLKDHKLRKEYHDKSYLRANDFKAQKIIKQYEKLMN